MAEEDDSSGIFEFVAVAAFALLLWWLSKKRPIRIEPSTTMQEIKDEFAADPDFSMEKYCQNVIYKPLSSNDLTTATLLGKGWCFRGDRSIVDEKKGFGDAYAEEQAKKYTEMKQNEAIFINNKLCVQFRLINSTASPITTDLLNVTQSSNIFDPVPDAPAAQAATAINENGFTANCLASSGAAGYFLDIATDISFLNYVTGYIAKDIGNVLSPVVTGLGAGTTYYYRFRAYRGSNISEDSAIISVDTDYITDIDGNQYTSVIIGTQEWMKQNLKTTKYADGTVIPNLTDSEYTDWYLPSEDEVEAIRVNLYLHAVGDYGYNIITSSESNATQKRVIYMTTGAHYNFNKDLQHDIIPIRVFTATLGEYSLRDVGPAGGYIFYIDGTTYYEAYPSILGGTSAYSNIINIAIGTTGTAIGTGQANTTAIIGQAGHTGSAAKLCDEFSAGGWINDTTGAYCYYNNDIANKADYGALYNWYAVDNAHGLAPTGWRIPTQGDNDILIAFIGGSSVAGGILKEDGLTHWTTPNTGATDDYGFKALGGGERLDGGTFSLITLQCFFWQQAYVRNLLYNSAAITEIDPTYIFGFSVRCMRDI